MRWALVVLLAIHGAIHFMGPAKAFGWSELEALTQPISRAMGVFWLVTGVTVLAAAVHLTVAPRSWWITGLVAAALSQAVVFSAWQDARFGTVANLIVLAAVAYTFLSAGPWSFRVRYERAVDETAAAASVVPWSSREGATGSSGGVHTSGAADASPADGPPGTDGSDVLRPEDLAHLPEAVRRYVVASGFVGAPKVAGFRVVSRGRIRASPDDPWMPFMAEQQNTLDPPSRIFHMRARRAGLPVDVLHVYRDGRATMRARVLSLVPVVDERGPEMDRAETVTLFNDLALMAPGGLAHADVLWETAGEGRVRGRFSAGSETVSALLLFDDDGELVDFVSDDRFAAVDGELLAWTWSTPVGSRQEVDAAGRRVRVVHRGDGRWHPDGGAPYTYLELEVVELELLRATGQRAQNALRRSDTAAALPDSALLSGL